MLTALFLLTGLAASAVAQDLPLEINDFRKEISRVAERIKDVVVGERQAAVAVGEFSGPPKFMANAGPGISELLSEALNKQTPGIVQTKADLAVSGKYAFLSQKRDDGERWIMKLTIQVVNQGVDEVVKEFVANCVGNPDITRFAGLTISLPPDGGSKERNEEIRRQMSPPPGSEVQPQGHLRGTQLRSSPQSPFAVEIRAKSVDTPGPAHPRSVALHEGLPFVEVRRGEVYELVISNDAPTEAAAAITIDGLNVFHFSEVRGRDGKPAYSHYLIPPRGSITVVGWHLRNAPPGNYSSFLVTEYGKGASVRAPRAAQGRIGVISVAFSKSLPAGSARSADSETGFGPPRDVTVQPQERVVEAPHDFVTLRYAR